METYADAAREVLAAARRARGRGYEWAKPENLKGLRAALRGGDETAICGELEELWLRSLILWGEI